MKKEIEVRIEELRKKETDYREIIITLNNDIINETFKPSEDQKTRISYIANQGRKTLAEIEWLENLLNNLPPEN